MDDADAALALSCADGWFELSGGEWCPRQPELLSSRVCRFTFDAEKVEAELLSVSGEDSSRQQHSGDRAAFTGLQHSGVQPSAGAMLLFLPSLPMLGNAEDDDVLQATEAAELGQANADDVLASGEGGVARQW